MRAEEKYELHFILQSLWTNDPNSGDNKWKWRKMQEVLSGVCGEAYLAKAKEELSRETISKIEEYVRDTKRYDTVERGY